MTTNVVPIGDGEYARGSSSCAAADPALSSAAARMAVRSSNLQWETRNEKRERRRSADLKPFLVSRFTFLVSGRV
jgi:hypothetical protein